jgi:hypothetical protein
MYNQPEFTAHKVTPDVIMAKIIRINNQSTRNNKKHTGVKFSRLCEICGLLSTSYTCEVLLLQTQEES